VLHAGDDAAAMKSMTILLQDVSHREQYQDVISFVGEDKSGSFGILPGHDRFMTPLEMGLCRFKTPQHEWLYVATAGALLYFYDNRICLTTRHFLTDSDYGRISAALAEQFLNEENRLHGQKQSLRQMEEEIIKRLWELRRSGVAYSQDEF
jgi:F-type H+-transporting ATPase subunit epsilon